MISKNSHFYYAPNLIVYHLVPRFKMTLSYPIKRAFIWGNETGRFNRPDTFRTLIVSLIRFNNYFISCFSEKFTQIT